MLEAKQSLPVIIEGARTKSDHKRPKRLCNTKQGRINKITVKSEYGKQG